MNEEQSEPNLKGIGLLIIFLLVFVMSTYVSLKGLALMGVILPPGANGPRMIFGAVMLIWSIFCTYKLSKLQNRSM